SAGPVQGSARAGASTGARCAGIAVLRQDRAGSLHGARQEGCGHPDRGRQVALPAADRRRAAPRRPGAGLVGQAQSGLSRGQGTIEYVAPALDPATGTLLVRGILANPDRTLLPGFFVKMRLPMGKVDQNALLVPDRALQEDQGGRYLLIVGKDDVVEQRYVKLGELVGAL